MDDLEGETQNRPACWREKMKQGLMVSASLRSKAEHGIRDLLSLHRIGENFPAIG
jgi:hypothetical protein